MIYRVLSGYINTNTQQLQISHTIVNEVGGQWFYEVEHSQSLAIKVALTSTSSAKELLQTDGTLGKTAAEAFVHFIEAKNLFHKVHFIVWHGYQISFEPGQSFIAGNPSVIATVCNLPVISHINTHDLSVGGNGNFSNNRFIENKLAPNNFFIDNENLSQYKINVEISIMGVYRWREENNIFAKDTGASRDTVNGALWMNS
jgi:1,6-anhydro-N-acetylmuramate kinase